MTTVTAPQRNVSADEAREVAEAAREQHWVAPSFVRDLFLGRLRMPLIDPYPEQDPEEVRRAQPFLEQLERFLRDEVDSDKIDREGEIPDAVIEGLRALGAFGIKIPREYGGLGLSQLSYMKAIELVSSVDGSVTALLSAHQSIGVPQPLKMFGSDAQKKKYFPRLAKGAISAFALTEPGVGSDPAAMETLAVPSPDGQAWILNGEKLWCTNGTKAELMVVMARTPSKVVNGREKRQITGVIIEADWPGAAGAERRDGGPRQLRHPARSGDCEAVQLRGRLADHRRDGADPRRPRLRDRGLAAGAGREARAGRAHHARLPHQPDLRGIKRDHASVHRPRGGGQAPAGGGGRGDAGDDARRTPARADARGPVLRLVVPVALARLGLLAEVHIVRAAGRARALRRARGPAAGARRVPRHGPLRPTAGIPPGGTVPPRRRGGRAVRDGSDLRARPVATAARQRSRQTGGGAGGLVLSPSARAHRGQVQEIG